MNPAIAMVNVVLLPTSFLGSQEKIVFTKIILQ